MSLASNSSDRVLPFTVEQYTTLNILVITCATVALLASLATTTFYIYMWVRHREKADRVSLRCVVMASGASSILNILIITQAAISTTKINACRALNVVSQAFDVFSCACLTTVGVNLVAVFVFNVKRAGLFTRLYLPILVVYSLLSMIARIYDEVTIPVHLREGTSCWYYNHIVDRLYGFVSWLVYYGFILFAVVVGLVCSAVALGKVIRDRMISQRTLRRYHNRFHPERDYSSKRRQEKAAESNKIPFSKIVTRCILYPLVPLFVHICSFVSEVVITQTDKRMPFPFVFVTVFLINLTGVFIALIFFSEPVVISFIRQMLSNVHRTYVKEFSVVDSRIHGDRIIHWIRQQPSSIASDQSTRNMGNNSRRLQPWPATTGLNRYRSDDAGEDDTDCNLQMPLSEISVTSLEGSNASISIQND